MVHALNRHAKRLPFAADICKFAVEHILISDKRKYLVKIAGSFHKHLKIGGFYVLKLVVGLFCILIYPCDRRFVFADFHRHIADNFNFGETEIFICVLLKSHAERTAGKQQVYNLVVFDCIKAHNAVVAVFVIGGDVTAVCVFVLKKRL